MLEHKAREKQQQTPPVSKEMLTGPRCTKLKGIQYFFPTAFFDLECTKCLNGECRLSSYKIIQPILSYPPGMDKQSVGDSPTITEENMND